MFSFWWVKLNNLKTILIKKLCFVMVGPGKREEGRCSSWEGGGWSEKIRKFLLGWQRMHAWDSRVLIYLFRFVHSLSNVHSKEWLSVLGRQVSSSWWINSTTCALFYDFSLVSINQWTSLLLFDWLLECCYETAKQKASIYASKLSGIECNSFLLY